MTKHKLESIIIALHTLRHTTATMHSITSEDKTILLKGINDRIRYYRENERELTKPVLIKVKKEYLSAFDYSTSL